MATELHIPPKGWTPRPHQVSIWADMLAEVKNILVVGHRRFGKSELMLHDVGRRAAMTPANYFYMFPEQEHARRAMMKSINRHTGMRRIDEAFPEGFRMGSVKEQEMVVEVRSARGRKSVIQFLGSDNYDAVRGASPYGVYLDEWAECDPQALAVLRPIVEENGGFFRFLTTPKGKNHVYKQYQSQQGKANWGVHYLTAHDTGVFSREQLAVILQENLDLYGPELGRGLFEQEYLCLHPGTRVLMADLTWKPIGAVQEGEAVIGIDEESSKATGRKLRHTVVTKRWNTTKTCRRITLSDGRSVTASMEHPWLCKQTPNRRQKTGWYRWITTQDLTVGMRIAESGLRPWVTDRTWEGGYLAGLYDGEGCVSRRTVQVSQKPGRVLDGAKQLLMDLGYWPFQTTSKGTHTLTLGLHATMTLLGSLRPLRLMEKARSVWEGAFPFVGVAPIEIVKIEDVGDEAVVGISTSTRTFIAEGLITHNCTFETVTPGSYYIDLLLKLEQSGRFLSILPSETEPVYAAFDLGWDDAMAIWYVQVMKDGNIHVVGYEEMRKTSIPQIVKILKEKSWSYGAVLIPHDGAHHEITSGETTETILTRNGFLCYVMPKTDEISQIASVRMLLPSCTFNPTACERGLTCLKAYHNVYKADTDSWSPKAQHDWSSHGAKAFATLAYFAPSLKRGVKGGAYARPVESETDRRSSLSGGGMGWMR